MPRDDDDNEEISKAIAATVQEFGCCFRCSLRFCNKRGDQEFNPYNTSFEDLHDYDGQKSPKRFKSEVCVCCIGLLQPERWTSMLEMLKDEIKSNEFDADFFAIGVSLPTSISLRERSLQLYLREKFPDWNIDYNIPLKQAWKWSIGQILSSILLKKLDSGSVSQFLVTFHMKYEYDTEELNSLKTMFPSVFEQRKRAFRKFNNHEFTRSNIDNFIERGDISLFRTHYHCPPILPKSPLECFKIEQWHNPIYLGGRYIKYSRELSQTPWIVDGKRMMENSIQDIIFKPLLDFFRISEENAESILKFISSGREDVDVRCLGDGRPFVIEILNPAITKFTPEQMNHLQIEMSNNCNLIKVIELQVISRNDLILLKEGEESKSKTYEALCIKLSNKHDKQNESVTNQEQVSTYPVNKEDIEIINNYSNSTIEKEIIIKQKTPLRVLHRRPLLIRERKIFSLNAKLVDGDPNLFIIELTTQAGTYIKEFVHGDFGRTKPNLSEIVGCNVDILALDVKSVNLKWPK